MAAFPAIGISSTSKQSPVAATPSPRKLPDIPTPKNTLTKTKISDDSSKPTDIVCSVITCRRHVSDDENAVCCNLCRRWTHQACAGFNQTEYKTLTKKSKYQDNLMWFCSGCLPAVTGFLEGRDPTTSPSRPGKPTGTAAVNELSKKIDALVDCVQKMEKSHQRREERFEEIIEEKVSNYLYQQKEKSNRQCNLIIHNLPESASKETEDRVDHDLKEVKGIFQHLEVDDATVTQPVRLGKKVEDSNKPRLLKVTVNSEGSRRRVLSCAKQLKRSKNQTLSRVYITPDLTYEERERNRKLREELKKRRGQGEPVIIKNGKIVRSDQPFHGSGDGPGGGGEAED